MTHIDLGRSGDAVDRVVTELGCWAETRRVSHDALLATFARALAAREGWPLGGWFAEHHDDALVARLIRDVELPSRAIGAPALIRVREAAFGAAERVRRGAHYTPLDVARPLAELALATFAEHGGVDEVTVCDPSVGGGMFLLAAAEALACRGLCRRDVLTRLFGCDTDAVAVEVARLALALWAGEPDAACATRIVVGDPLRADRLWADVRQDFGVVLGNPPFLSQLRDRSARSRADARDLTARFGAAAAGYVDTSALFLLRAVQLAGDGGVVLLIQPQSILASRDAEAVRRAVVESTSFAGLWIARDSVFAAGVRVCAPLLVKSPLDRPVRRFVDRSVREVDALDTACGVVTGWGEAAADLLGAPARPAAMHTDGALGDDGYSATAGFRDQYYGLAPAVREEEAGPATATTRRVVTSGLIDPLHLAWGERAARYAGTVWHRPVADLDAVDPKVHAWFVARDRPKVLVATQTRVVECAVDCDGTAVPVTPVIACCPPPERLWHAAAALTNPVSCLAAVRVSVGTALSAGAIKLSARQVLELPRPLPGSAWDTGARLARGLAADAAARAEPAAWAELGRVMCRAYGLDDGADARRLVDWWLDRLGHGPTAGAESP